MRTCAAVVKCEAVVEANDLNATSRCFGHAHSHHTHTQLILKIENIFHSDHVIEVPNLSKRYFFKKIQSAKHPITHVQHQECIYLGRFECHADANAGIGRNGVHGIVSQYVACVFVCEFEQLL